MEFHDFATTHDVARRVGLTDDPADRFYREMQAVAIHAYRRGIPGTASEFNRYQSELNWCDAGRPYYKLWPAVIPLLAGVGIDVPERPGFQSPAVNMGLSSRAVICQPIGAAKTVLSRSHTRSR